MDFPKSYFEDEVRDGFYVPCIMKRAWAAQLELLEDIDRICQKYNIEYFAEWGTLLGAIRHQGYIPWDDDMDICMKRKDYMRFFQVAEKELGDKHCFFTNSTDVGNTNMVARILNGEHICMDEDYLKKYHDFPFAVGIDIFILDYIPPSQEEDRQQKEVVKAIATIATELDPEDTVGEKYRTSIEQIEDFCNVKFDPEEPLQIQLFRMIEKIYSLYTEEEANDITIMVLWNEESDYKFPKEYYERSIRVPFENTTIPVPVGYDAILKRKYGEYMRLVRDGGDSTHDYPFFLPQEGLMGERGNLKYATYQYNPDAAVRREDSIQYSLQEGVNENLALLGEALGQVEKYIHQFEKEMAQELLAQCQEMAVATGTWIEESEGQGHPIVSALEDFCESVYQISCHMDDVEQWMEQASSILASIDTSSIASKRELVILVYKVSQWRAIQSVWQQAKMDEDMQVSVVVVPYYYRDFIGNFTEMRYEIDEFPKEINPIPYDAYNFESRHPDTIITQCPYDEYNHAISIHPYFYNSNIKQFTNNLIYIPPFKVEEFTMKDYRPCYHAQYYITVPGVALADQTIVQSENMRNTYIDILTDWAGEETRPLWESKIIGSGLPLDDVEEEDALAGMIPEEWREKIFLSDGTKKKVILYQMSPSNMVKYQRQAIQKHRNAFSVFEKMKDKVTLLWRPNAYLQTFLEGSNDELWKEYQALEREYGEKEWCILDKRLDDTFAVQVADAYYGDGEVIAHICQERGLPVLIEDVEIF